MVVLRAGATVVSTASLFESLLDLFLRHVVQVGGMKLNSEILDDLLHEALVGRDSSALADGGVVRNPGDEDELGTGREFITRGLTEESVGALAVPGREGAGELVVSTRTRGLEDDGVGITARDIIGIAKDGPLDCEEWKREGKNLREKNRTENREKQTRIERKRKVGKQEKEEKKRRAKGSNGKKRRKKG